MQDTKKDMEHFSEVFRILNLSPKNIHHKSSAFLPDFINKKRSFLRSFFQGLKGNPSLQERGGAFFWSSVGGNSKFICFKPNIFGDVSIFFNTKDLFETSLYEVWKVIVLRIVDGSVWSFWKVPLVNVALVAIPCVKCVVKRSPHLENLRVSPQCHLKPKAGRMAVNNPASCGIISWEGGIGVGPSNSHDKCTPTVKYLTQLSELQFLKDKNMQFPRMKPEKRWFPLIFAS